MATSQLSGVNYELNGNTIDFFGAKGTKFDGSTWGINAFGGNLWAAVSPDSIMDRVHECIAGDIEDGNGDKIAQLQLGPRQAVVFYLEGRLTREHLKGAVEGPEFIDVPNVDLDGRTLTVRIQENPQYDIATADSEGNVL